MSRAAGDLAAARSYYEKRLAISQKLADADPYSAEKQRDLGVSHFRLSDVEQQIGNEAAKHEHLTAGVAAWGKLAAEGKLPSPTDRASLERRRRQLHELAD